MLEMTAQLSALALMFILVGAWMLYIVIKTEREWREEFKKDETVDDGQLLSSENVAQ